MNAMSKGELEAIMEGCFADDDVPGRTLTFLVGRRYKMPRLLKLSLGRRQGDRYRGPFAETKEQLGGIVVILANDLDHAIELLSKHSGVRLGVRLVEIARLTRRLTLGLQLGSPGLKRLRESANGLNGIVARGRS